MVDDVAAGNNESSWYERQLLTRLARMRQVFGGQIQAIRLSDAATGSAVNHQVAETAGRFGASTPARFASPGCWT